jgi:hypothetical protein
MNIRVASTIGFALSVAACSSSSAPATSTTGAGGGSTTSTTSTTSTAGAGGYGPCTPADPFCRHEGGLAWTEKSAELDHAAAAAHCQSLGGRLPTIDELRPLFVGCDVCLPAGPCKVSEACASTSCETTTCQNGCGDGGHCVFGGDEPFWSSTLVSDAPTKAFVAVYRYGSIRSYDRTWKLPAFCVK